LIQCGDDVVSFLVKLTESTELGVGDERLSGGHRVSLSMYGGTAARKKRPVPALAESKVVRGLRKVGVRVEALDYGLYLLNIVKTQVLGIRLNI
jgi:hypothetical protein